MNDVRWYDYIFAGVVVFWFIVRNGFSVTKAKKQIYTIGRQHERRRNEHT